MPITSNLFIFFKLTSGWRLYDVPHTLHLCNIAQNLLNSNLFHERRLEIEWYIRNIYFYVYFQLFHLLQYS